LAAEYIQTGIDALPHLPDEPPALLPDDSPYAELARSYLSALLQGQRAEASRLIHDAVRAGVPVRDIYLHVFEPVQHEIGRLWQKNEVTVAQEHFCTASTQWIMSQLYPHILTSPRKQRVMVATCVGGDLHEIGVRMIADFFEMEGWETHYLGANTPAASIVQMIQDRNADLLAVSATMTYHIRQVAELIVAIRTTRRGKQVKIMVGGYPFNLEPTLWREIGADAFARNAEESLSVAESLFA